MRMHMIIYSIMAHVPFVAIAYERKSHELAKQVGLPQFCIDLAELTAIELFDKMELAYGETNSIKAHLKEAQGKLCRRSLQNARIFFNIVSGLPPLDSCDLAEAETEYLIL
jgi:polysaccharide pyruvyl transferase WcaK-like protein